MSQKHCLVVVKILLAAVAGLTFAGGPPTAAQVSEQQGTPEKSQLPPGHPTVVTPASPADALPPLPSGSGIGAAALEWQVPAGWTVETPSSSMRRAQYRIPGDGDGECVVYYFGPGQGGDAMLNAERWAGQFAQPDGRPSREVMQTETIEVNGIPVFTVEVTGTYDGGFMMGAPRRAVEDAMLLGAIAEGPDANWFFKCTGPETTLRPQRDAFVGMIRSLKRGE